uniref:p11 n=1 Tax=Helicoverpa armigera stunt virus TaxID=37206 RepID=A0A1V0JZP9_HASV|nr:p11 [Helicoverpa armigera stunt virus]ARD24701.1 p11 [Helicoverpa armigera stunt virus]ARD24704.1 p11 [Helicoverpa armigera stunt virus]
MCEAGNAFFTYRESWCFCDYKPRCDWDCAPGVSMGCTCSQQLFGVIDTGDPVHIILAVIVFIGLLYIVWKVAQWWRHRKDHRRLEQQKAAFARQAITLV